MPTESTVLHNDPDFDWHWTWAEWDVRLKELENQPDLEIVNMGCPKNKQQRNKESNK